MIPPELHLETARLTTRLPKAEDAPRVVRYYERNRAHLRRWDPRRSEAFYTLPYWRDRIAGARREYREGRSAHALVCLGDGPDAVIGTVGFSNIVRGAFHACHLGFGIDHRHEGEGKMTEALTAFLAFGFEAVHLHRVEANHRPDNDRSARLLRRLGFAPQGFARDYLRIDGEWRDHVLTALTNDAWTPPP